MSEFTRQSRPECDIPSTVMTNTEAHFAMTDALTALTLAQRLEHVVRRQKVLASLSAAVFREILALEGHSPSDPWRPDVANLLRHRRKIRWLSLYARRPGTPEVIHRLLFWAEMVLSREP